MAERHKFPIGNPGKPKGAKSKTTLIKQQILELFAEKKVKEKIGEMLENKNKNDLKWFVDGIIKILPKNIDVDLSGEIKPIEFIIKKSKND